MVVPGPLVWVFAYPDFHFICNACRKFFRICFWCVHVFESDYMFKAANPECAERDDRCAHLVCLDWEAKEQVGFATEKFNFVALAAVRLVYGECHYALFTDDLLKYAADFIGVVFLEPCALADVANRLVERLAMEALCKEVDCRAVAE